MGILFRHATVRSSFAIIVLYGLFSLFGGGVARATCSFRAPNGQCYAGEIVVGAAEAMALLGDGRYTPDGSGPALYAFMSQVCPYSQAFIRDRPHFGGVQFRYYPFAAVGTNNDQTAQVLKTRVVTDFYEYMHRTLAAPPFQQVPDGVNRFNDEIHLYNRLDVIMAENDLYHVTTPTWFWIKDDKVFWTRGYGGAEHFQLFLKYQIRK